MSSFDAPPQCQACGHDLTQTLVDLGMQPLANSYLSLGQAEEDEPLFPLHARVCGNCLLVQVDKVSTPEAIFTDYAYFSSFSESWLAHCREYVAAMIKRFNLNSESRVVEIASNDGYMLQYFVERGVPVLGIEPAANVARSAVTRGVATEVAFFGLETARRLVAEGGGADLLAAKNVLAHVPDINDFVAGVEIMLKPKGVFTVEFPHLLNLIKEVQFDTIYHEHYTYLSLLALDRIFARHGLTIFDVEKLPTHGGSLRVFAARRDAGIEVSPRISTALDEERAAGLDRPIGYEGFTQRVEAVRDGLVAFFADAEAHGKVVAGYGAAAKGNTLFNYCGVTANEVAIVVDRNPAKQSTLLPGSHIEVRPVEAIDELKPDYVLILPWNLRDEIIAQMGRVTDWGGRFVTAIPTLEVMPECLD